VRVLRISFSGELAYELHTPSDHGLHLWETVLAAGGPFDIALYGTEAMTILRIEKGHVVGAELDGRTVASDFGFDALYRRKEGDFIGRRALEREGLAAGPHRKTLVGLVSLDGQRIPAGAQLVENPTAPRPVRMLGHVTSAACVSPHVGKPIALGLLERGAERKGDRLVASAPLKGQQVHVEVTDPVFVDPEGRRVRG